MMIGNYRQFTLCWIIISSIWLFLSITPSVQADQFQCDDTCIPVIKDQDRKYLEFKRLVASDSVKVIFFKLYIDNRDFNQGNDSTVFFAWIKNRFGKAIFLLPTSSMVMSLSLYTIFMNTLNITLLDPTQECYHDYTYDCRNENIFKALIDFTRLRLNNTCNDKFCSTICRRDFVSYDGNFNTTIQASCCQKDLPNSDINITQCLTPYPAEQSFPYIPLSQLFIILLSIFLAGFTLNNIINWFISSIGRYRKIDGTPVYILNDIKRCEIGHIYLPIEDYNNPTMHLTHAIKYSLPVIIIALAYEAFSTQRFSDGFLIYPKMQLSNYPTYLIQGWVGEAFANGTFILTIILTDIKLYYHTKYKTSRHLPYSDISQRQRFITPISFGQSYFLVKIYLYDIIDDLKSLHVIKLVLDIIDLALLLSHVILGSFGVLRCCIFLAEGLALRFRTAFLSDQPAGPIYRLFNTIMSLCFTFISFIYTGSILYHSIILLETIFRIILTTSAFIITFATHFNFIIVMAIPFMHYIIQIIDTYIRNDQIIPEKIIQLQQMLDQKIDEIFKADQGNLDIYIAVNYNGTVIIDLPEMLQEDHIRLCIKHYIQYLKCKPNHRMIDGIFTFTLQYERLSDNKVNIVLLQCINGCSKCPFQQEVEPVLNCIQKHLQQSDIDHYKRRLSSIYYQLEDGPGGTSIAIPEQLYQYLRYHSPQISLSLGHILFNVIVIAAFFAIFIFTAMLNYRATTFASLNSAIANTPAVYVATVLSLRNLKVVKIKEEEIDKILLVNMIQYRRGYRLFCTRGIHFRPFVQLLKMTMLDNYDLQYVNNIESKSDDDTNAETDHTTSYNNRIQHRSIWAMIKEQLGHTDVGYSYLAIDNDFEPIS